MDDLFSMGASNLAPLADRMRPRTLSEFVGQEQIVGKGKLLRRAIEADRLTSSIFWGPPGTGKTTLASIIAETTLLPAAWPMCARCLKRRKTA